MIGGESSEDSTLGAWSRSSTQSYAGTYSWELIGNSYACLTDNQNATDLHGLTPGKGYWFSCKLYYADPQPLKIQFQYSVNGSTFSAITFHDGNAGYAYPEDEWISINGIVELPSTATGAFIIFDDTDGTGGTYMYFDDISLYEFGDSDSGCQLVNCAVSDCTDTGVIIANSHTLVQNNQITGNTNKGLVIAAGYRNLVTGNRCYNNGADTGLANDNQDNFYDAGIDTQLG
jgi:parallel beta-helix repeat protein